MDLNKIQEQVKSTLSEERYIHSVGVMHKAEELARKYGQGINIKKVKLTAIIHDIAKEMSDKECYDYIEQHNIQIDDIERENTNLLHAIIGAEITKKYGFDNEMKNAIRNHTTANINMSILDKIIFVADAIEPNRKFKDLQYAIELADKSLDEAIIYILNLNIKECIEKGKTIHPNSILARNEIILKSKR